MMGGLDKVEKIMIGALVVFVASMLSLGGIRHLRVLVCGHASRLRHDDGQDRRRDMGLSDRPWQDHRLRHSGGIQVKKVLENMIIKWHQAGYSLDEIAPLVPQVPKAEVAAIIRQHDKEARL